MKPIEILCPFCKAPANIECHAFIKSRKKETGELKSEWLPIPEIHKERKQAVVMEMIKHNRGKVK